MEGAMNIPNAKLIEADLQAWLIELIPFKKLHAQFLNTLSLLEYIGARKLIKSQHEKTITSEVLSHAAEEIRHAQTLKRAAQRLLTSEPSGEQVETFAPECLLAPAAAHQYIQRIDFGVEKKLTSHDTASKTVANYLLTTLLLEERAGSLYPIYEKALKQSPEVEKWLSPILRSIIREEDSHLQAVVVQLEREFKISPSILNELREIELVEFNNFLSELRRNLA